MDESLLAKEHSVARERERIPVVTGKFPSRDGGEKGRQRDEEGERKRRRKKKRRRDRNRREARSGAGERERGNSSRAMEIISVAREGEEGEKREERGRRKGERKIVREGEAISPSREEERRRKRKRKREKGGISFPLASPRDGNSVARERAREKQ